MLREGLFSKNVMRLVLAAMLLALLCLPGQSQDTQSELANLRKHLELPDSTPIKLSLSSTLPPNRPLNVFIAVGLDVGVRGNFSRWLAEWNKKDGKRHGLVSLVSEISQAQVILARYALRDRVTTETNTRVVPGVAIDPSTGQTVTRPVPRTSSYSVVPVYAYVISRNPAGLEIIWRYVGQDYVAETKRSGQKLRDDCFTLMKSRQRPENK